MGTVLKQLLLLSHGQATVERGFSLNKEVTVENMKKATLIARRHIVDYCRNVGVTKVEITKGMLVSASSARQKYLQHLEKIKKDKVDAKRALEHEGIISRVSEMKAK